MLDFVRPLMLHGCFKHVHQVAQETVPGIALSHIPNDWLSSVSPDFLPDQFLSHPCQTC
jgi:hypothetical protein